MGVFGLCQIVSFIDYLKANMTKENFNILFKTLSIAVASIFGVGFGVMTLSGKVAPWTGRFYSLLDPSYAKNNIPIIASVSEHQPTSWSSFYFDLQILTILFPAGLYYCFTRLTDHNIFIILYGVTSVYFAGVMVRLMLGKVIIFKKFSTTCDHVCTFKRESAREIYLKVARLF